jgi:chemotaxis protein histidine kinase CheA
MASQTAPSAAGQAEVFDHHRLRHHTMQDQALAAEILGLFLSQLPAMLEALDGAGDVTEWAFATHTLKGSAALVGAQRLHALAADLERIVFPGDINVRLLRVQAVHAAAAEFRQAARTAYPAAG